MKRVLPVLLVASLVCSGCGRPEQPNHYQGKSLRYWEAAAASRRPADRRAAAEALGKIGAAGLPAAVKLLYDRNPRVQAAAILAVVGMGQTAVPPLVQLLQDPDPKARLRAVKTLEFLGLDAKEAIPALKEAVHDDNPGVRRAAQRAVKTVSTKTKPTVLRSRRSPWQRPPAGPDILPPR